MGMLVDGRWTDEDRVIVAGAFVRAAGVYRGDLGAAAAAALWAEPGRFHLIASASCPWSHFAMIVRQLKGLMGTVPLWIAGGPRAKGYPVNGGAPWRVPGTDRHILHVHELYGLSDPGYTGRATVPVLWDSRIERIAGNESASIGRAFDGAVDPDDSRDFTLRPAALRDAIDALNARVHDGLANAVYRAGLAQRQDAYDEAVAQVFATLDMLDDRLADRRHLFGAVVTEADWRLFATLVRFDAVYHTHFRCTRRRLVDYAHLWPYARDLYAWRGVAALVDFAAIREGYYRNDGVHNPFGVVAAAPDANWSAPHGRAALGPAQVALRSGGVRAVAPDAGAG